MLIKNDIFLNEVYYMNIEYEKVSVCKYILIPHEESLPSQMSPIINVWRVLT